jgi:hypothetical protein
MPAIVGSGEPLTLAVDAVPDDLLATIAGGPHSFAAGAVGAPVDVDVHVNEPPAPVAPLAPGPLVVAVEPVVVAVPPDAPDAEAADPVAGPEPVGDGEPLAEVACPDATGVLVSPGPSGGCAVARVVAPGACTGGRVECGAVECGAVECGAVERGVVGADARAGNTAAGDTGGADPAPNVHASALPGCGW